MIQALLVAVVSAAVAMAVFVAGARAWPRSWQQSDDHAAGGMVFDMINTFFVAVVAFVVVLCWQQYDNAESHTVEESKALIDTYWIAHELPDQDRQRVQGLVRDYTEQVLGQEWTVMDHDARLSATPQRTLESLRDTVSALPTDDEAAKDLRDKALDSVRQINAARQDRAVDVRRGIPEFLTIALWFGTVLVLLNPVFSGFRVTLKNVLMIGLLGLVIGLVLLQINHLERPFSHLTVVPRDAFENALSNYDQVT
ncbi:bestrophin-like domain [Nocardia sp. NPDC003482]